MPVEIRELIIRSNIESRADGEQNPTATSDIDVEELRKRILADCKKYIDKQSKQNKSR